MKIVFKGKTMSVKKLQYRNDRTALELVYRGEPFCFIFCGKKLKFEYLYI